MAKISKYLKIDSLSGEDVHALFNAICEKILLMDPIKAKREVLKIRGNDSEIKEHRTTIASLLTLIAHFDIKTEFKVLYVEFVPDPPEPDAPLFKDHEDDHLAEQVKEIEAKTMEELQLNPGHLGGKKIEIVEVDNATESEPRKEEDLPDFD